MYPFDTLVQLGRGKSRLASTKRTGLNSSLVWNERSVEILRTSLIQNINWLLSRIVVTGYGLINPFHSPSVRFQPYDWFVNFRYDHAVSRDRSHQVQRVP